MLGLNQVKDCFWGVVFATTFFGTFVYNFVQTKNGPDWETVEARWNTSQPQCFLNKTNATDWTLLNTVRFQDINRTIMVDFFGILTITCLVGFGWLWFLARKAEILAHATCILTSLIGIGIGAMMLSGQQYSAGIIMIFMVLVISTLVFCFDFSLARSSVELIKMSSYVVMKDVQVWVTGITFLITKIIYLGFWLAGTMALFRKAPMYEDCSIGVDGMTVLFLFISWLWVIKTTDMARKYSIARSFKDWYDDSVNLGTKALTSTFINIGTPAKGAMIITIADLARYSARMIERDYGVYFLSCVVDFMMTMAKKYAEFTITVASLYDTHFSEAGTRSNYMVSRYFAHGYVVDWYARLMLHWSSYWASAIIGFIIYSFHNTVAELDGGLLIVSALLLTFPLAGIPIVLFTTAAGDYAVPVLCAMVANLVFQFIISIIMDGVDALLFLYMGDRENGDVKKETVHRCAELVTGIIVDYNNSSLTQAQTKVIYDASPVNDSTFLDVPAVQGVTVNEIIEEV